MTPLKQLRKLLRNWVEDESIDDIFQDFINFAIAECESTANFSELYAETTVTPVSGVFTEPALCREILDIVPYTSTGYPKFRFEFRNRDIVESDGGMLQYTIQPYAGFDAPESSHECSFDQGENTLSQEGATFFTSADVGKRLMIEENEGIYEIVSVSGTDPNQSVVIKPSVSAADSDSAMVTVNPAGTKRFILKTPENAPYEGAVTIKYQRKHPIVYSDASLLLIPCPQSVALLALQQALVTNKYDVDAERLQTAVMMAKNRELDGHSFKATKTSRADSMFSVRSKR
jgi:hypothetical protein